MRLAIISTPRCGNTWLRAILSLAGEASSQAVHRPDDVPWNDLPPRFVLQIHWMPEPEFSRRLAHHGFRVVTLLRHPLDVLISILHFCTFETETDAWLDGEGGSETSLRSATPVSPEFLAYATGPRAQTLLQISTRWMQECGVVARNYEQLLDNPLRELQDLFHALAIRVDPERLSDSLAFHSFENLKNRSANHHFWQGRPGLWRKLLPAKVAHAIAEAHAPLFQAAGYRCDPDPDLSPTAALEQWFNISAKKSSAFR